MTENSKAVINKVLEVTFESNVREAIDTAMYDYLDEGWEDEYDDAYEAYQETGRGEAESQVFQEIITSASYSLSIELTTDEYCEVLDHLKEDFDISW